MTARLKVTKIASHPKMKELQKIMRELDRVPGLLRELESAMNDRDATTAQMLADGYESLYSRLESLVVLSTVEEV